MNEDKRKIEIDDEILKYIIEKVRESLLYDEVFRAEMASTKAGGCGWFDVY